MTQEPDVGSSVCTAACTTRHSGIIWHGCVFTVRSFLRRLTESKQAYRAQLATRPIAEKLRMFEKLRKHALAIAASRRKWICSGTGRICFSLCCRNSLLSRGFVARRAEKQNTVLSFKNWLALGSLLVVTEYQFRKLWALCLNVWFNLKPHA